MDKLVVLVILAMEEEIVNLRHVEHHPIAPDNYFQLGITSLFHGIKINILASRHLSKKATISAS